MRGRGCRMRRWRRWMDRRSRRWSRRLGRLACRGVLHRARVKKAEEDLQRDALERQRLEEALLNAEERWRNAVEATGLGTWHWQIAGETWLGLSLVPAALRLLELGVRCATVNVGGLHYTAGRVQLGKAIFLGDEDREALRAISRRGVALEGRALPGDSTLDIVSLLGGLS